ncbi:MAG TPA: sensor histidine kinase KdpD [Candidatus Margulisiibacteriota bacterium]|nr:sensor histidine kinase KdpD [Candidatus Margulisiibacteriota bacterium]
MDRPNPDELLENIKREESQRGKLKIFFGAAAGVGKTYSMLESARMQKKEGIDIVAGWVETHKRVETEALLEGLEILSPKVIKYKNVELSEFDIDAALARKPAVILVDELAHTNAPGSRHPKRWQDVEELLDKGIDVYTTLNVQHCESATDIVAQITGIPVRETVPDTMVENADEIELVDLPTENLLKRLKDGKVYLGDMAERATHHFFQPGNLIALRQLALRYTAHNVDEKLMVYKQAHAVSKVWGARDRFLVCISASPNAVRLIRAGKRIASDLGVNWNVVYVETGAQSNEKDRARIAEMMRLAEKLGAQVATLSSQDVAEALISYARSKNINKIIAGKPEKLKFREFVLGSSIIDKLAIKSGEIDLYLLSGEKQGEPIKVPALGMVPFSWVNFLKTLGIIILCTLIDWAVLKHLALVNLIMIYLLGVTWAAFKYGRRMSMIASFLSVIFFDFFFVPPYFSIAISDIEYLFTFAVMLTVGFIIAQLTGRLRRQANLMRIREDRMQVLYALSRELSKSSYPDELFKIALKHIEEYFKCKAVIFTLEAKKNLTPRFGSVEEINLNPNEIAVAQWSYENKKPAGKDTDTLPGSKGFYLPFVGAEKTVGVLGMFPTQDKQFVDPEQWHILEVFVSQAALAVEGAQLAATALEAASKIESERLKNLLLTTYSSGLPGPLTSISHIASELLKPENINDDLKRASLIAKMRQEIDRLNTLIAEIPQIIESEA